MPYKHKRDCPVCDKPGLRHNNRVKTLVGNITGNVTGNITGNVTW